MSTHSWAVRIFPVADFRANGAPAFLKRYESEIVAIRTPQFKLLAALVLCVLDCIPKQEGHCSKPVKPRIAAAIFVNHVFFVGQGEDARNGQTIFGCNTNLQAIAERS